MKLTSKLVTTFTKLKFWPTVRPEETHDDDDDQSTPLSPPSDCIEVAEFIENN